MTHSSARAPPMEPPTTAATSVMPRRGQRREVGVHLIAHGDRGEPRTPRLSVRRKRTGPGRAAAAAEDVGGDRAPAVGVDRGARAGDAVPPARGRVVGAGRAGDMRVARQRVQHDDDVVALRRQLAPPLHGDRHVVEHDTGLQRQGADVDDADLAFGGQRRSGERRPDVDVVTRRRSRPHRGLRHAGERPSPRRSPARDRRGCRRSPRCRRRAGPGRG